MFWGMDSVFIWPQVIGLFAMTINILAWQIKKTRHIFLCNAPASFLWATQYMLLSAPMGVLTNFTSVFKDILIAFIKDKYLPILIFLFLAILWAIGLQLISNAKDILPLCSLTLYNLALLRRDNRQLISRTVLLNQVGWMIYNSIVGAWMGFACAILISFSALLGMARHEEWEIGKSYKSFTPNLMRALFVMPNFRISP